MQQHLGPLLLFLVLRLQKPNQVLGSCQLRPVIKDCSLSVLSHGQNYRGKKMKDTNVYLMPEKYFVPKGHAFHVLFLKSFVDFCSQVLCLSRNVFIFPL